MTIDQLYQAMECSPSGRFAKSVYDLVDQIVPLRGHDSQQERRLYSSMLWFELATTNLNSMTAEPQGPEEVDKYMSRLIQKGLVHRYDDGRITLVWGVGPSKEVAYDAA